MGQRDAFVDATGVHEVASRFDETAHRIDGAVRTQFAALAFNGVSAGRAYVGQGDAVRFALHRLGGELTQWARATAEVASVLRVSADRYAEADRRAAAGIA